MRTYKYIPYLSLIGFCFFIGTLLVNIGFWLSTDVGFKILFSTFSAVLLFFTSLWGVMGVIELIQFIKKTKSVKTGYLNHRMDKETYLARIKNLKVCFVINAAYLVTISIQMGYVIYNWESINI